MKAKAVSSANIAFIKFWGKKVPSLNIPFNNSISMNLSNCLTKTTVEFRPDLKKDMVLVNKKTMSSDSYQRVVRFLNIIRKMARINYKAKVYTQNNFPSDAGIASSASGFSALALAASTAAGLKLNKNRLSALARLGSGSACRSIPDGFSEWRKGKSDESSYAREIFPVNYWDLCDIVAVVSSERKKKSSGEGHEAALTSPYFKERQKQLPKRITDFKMALQKKDFELLGKLIEEEAIDLHLIAMSSKPPIFYLNNHTFEVIESLRAWREKGLQAYFTMDAGPNVHVICREKDVVKVNSKLKKIPGVNFTIVNYAALGTRLI